MISKERVHRAFHFGKPDKIPSAPTNLKADFFPNFPSPPRSWQPTNYPPHIKIGSKRLGGFFFKKGPSLTISESAKPKLFAKMRQIIQEVKLPVSLLGVIVLAFTVNSVELLCTAGFPAIYTKILTLNNLSTFSYYAYLLLYIIMYMIDDMLIFSIAVITLSSKKMTEKQGKWMKFIAGFMMLGLGLLLVFKPEILMFG